MEQHTTKPTLKFYSDEDVLELLETVDARIIPKQPSPEPAPPEKEKHNEND